MFNKYSLLFLIGLISMCYARSLPLGVDEVATLSKTTPCLHKDSGTRLRHPTDDHKFLRCISPDSFWVETCPDGLFYNYELELCDWSTVSLSTTPGTDLVKFRPVLFKGNKTLDFETVDPSKTAVRVTSQRRPSKIRPEVAEIFNDEEVDSSKTVDREEIRPAFVTARPTTTATTTFKVTSEHKVFPVREEQVVEEHATFERKPVVEQHHFTTERTPLVVTTTTEPEATVVEIIPRRRPIQMRTTTTTTTAAPVVDHVFVEIESATKTTPFHATTTPVRPVVNEPILVKTSKVAISSVRVPPASIPVVPHRLVDPSVVTPTTQTVFPTVLPTAVRPSTNIVRTDFVPVRNIKRQPIRN